MAPDAVLFLDVNETLLDLQPLKDQLRPLLGNSDQLVQLWFRQLLHYSLVETVAGTYTPFGEIGLESLNMVARSSGLNISLASAKKALSAMREAPPHPDVIPALRRLRSAGLRLVALTNSDPPTMQSQLKNSGLSEILHHAYSVAEVGCYKPDRRVYDWAAAKEGIPAEKCWMVAAHAWDVSGAKWAGWNTVFVERPGQTWYALGPKPDHLVKDLGNLADEFC